MKGRMAAVLSFFLFVMSVFTLYVPRIFSVQAGNVNRAERGVFNGNDLSRTEIYNPYDRHGYLRIPLPESLEEDKISIEEDPWNRRFIIRIKGVEEDFFTENSFSGDIPGIEDIRYGFIDGISTIELDTGDISLPVTAFSRGSLYIRAVSPHEKYKRVIAVDAGHDEEDPGSKVYGIEEQSITHGLAHRLCRKLEDEDTFVIMTDPEEGGFSEEERAEIVNNTDADLLISLHTTADPDTRVTSGVQAYASPEIGKEVLSLTGRLSGACSQKDLGMADRPLSGITSLTNVPFLGIRLGYMTNKAEAEKMDSSSYQEKAAEEIAGFTKNLIREGKID